METKEEVNGLALNSKLKDNYYSQSVNLEH